MAEWYEDDEKIHNESPVGVWWQGTRKNAQRVCPDVLATTVGFGFGSFSTLTNAGESLGYNTSLSIIRGAGTKTEIGLAGMVTGIAWCGGGYLSSGLDSLYQMHHHGEHLLGMHAVDWYIAKEQGVENFLIKFREWWRA